MKNLLFIFLLFFAYKFAYAVEEITIIELHNKSIDQIINEGLSSENTNKFIESESDLEGKQTNNENENNQLESLADFEVSEFPDIWLNINEVDLNFFLSSIDNINSNLLKKELISILNPITDQNKIVNRPDHNKYIIDMLLKLGDRKKSYQIIQLLEKYEESAENSFYKEFILNYLLSTYKLSEACVYREEIKNLNLKSKSNFFLKIDILCLALQEKFDEANLLNSLLIEFENNQQDEYFQFLFNKLQNIDIIIRDNNFNTQNIFLYSAMHRIGNLPLTEEFLDIDPINLSMPIILSYSSDIKLRLKSAHFAYYNDLIGLDSLAALYQSVDFKYDELNSPTEFFSSSKHSPEIGMAYYYQLINIQLLPITRLEAIIKFWDFAEKNNLEEIAYELSIKNLNTIEPSNELAMSGSKIAKAYILNENFIFAEKWLLFTENSIQDPNKLHSLNSSKLLYDLYSQDQDSNLSEVLLNSLQYMNTNLLDNDNQSYELKIEILNLIFSTLNNNDENPFIIEKKIIENKTMPSFFLLNNIRNAAKNNNQLRLLLNIILSMDGKNWNEIHPEHLRIILLGLKEYEDGLLINDIILELLHANKII